MKSTVINTSKEIMCFSDFPIPSEYPMYMHNTYVQKYFNLYADKFNLRKCIRFETEVIYLEDYIVPNNMAYLKCLGRFRKLRVVCRIT